MVAQISDSPLDTAGYYDRLVMPRDAMIIDFVGTITVWGRAAQLIKFLIAITIMDATIT